jgi:hypothetical protein
MPYISHDEYQKQKQRIKTLEDKLEKHDIFLKNCRGSPTMVGYQGKKIDLNDNLNVVELLKRITILESKT